VSDGYNELAAVPPHDGGVDGLEEATISLPTYLARLATRAVAQATKCI
jgi:hypothetical protein